MDGWMDEFIYPDPSQSDMQATTTIYIRVYMCDVPLPENELRASSRPIMA